MKSRDVQNWSVNISNIDNQDTAKHIVMFSCPFINTNIIYTGEQIRDMIANSSMSTVPREVMMSALQSIEMQGVAA